LKKFIILLLAIVLLLPVRVNAATVYTISSDNYTLFPKETIVLEILKKLRAGHWKSKVDKQ
jgi:hypothetical protein